MLGNLPYHHEKWLRRCAGSGVVRDHKLSTASLGDLQECLTSHILNAWVRFFHELEKLVHDRLQELPVFSEKVRILAHDVHYVGGNDSLQKQCAQYQARPKAPVSEQSKGSCVGPSEQLRHAPCYFSLFAQQ